MRIAVTGAGGAIGGHLVSSLVGEGHEVVAIDRKFDSDWYQRDPRIARIIDGAEGDMTDRQNALAALDGCEHVYALAADMGGMGYISSQRVNTWHSVDITSTTLWAASYVGVKRLFYSSSACVYPDYVQQENNSLALRESDAWPADPEPCYGLEKLYGEEGCKWYKRERGLETRVARYHNVYGTYGTFDGGREKLPAAACRKVAEAVKSGSNTVEIWGDGEQRRSYMFMSDCIIGTRMIMAGDYDQPVNLGSSESVSVNEVYDMLEGIAGVTLKRVYIDGPVGVRGRNSDNTLIEQIYGWSPRIALNGGLRMLYPWIYDRVS